MSFLDGEAKKGITIAFAPGALDHIPEELHGELLGELAELFLLPGAAERTIGRSRRVMPTPVDGRCPDCTTVLTPDPTWEDEATCENGSCSLSEGVVFIDDDLHRTIMERRDAARNLSQEGDSTEA